MKTILAAALALILGLFLGGLGPRSEARRLAQELEQAKAAAAQNQAGLGAATGLPLALGGLVAAQERAAAEAARAGAAKAPPPKFVPLPPEPKGEDRGERRRRDRWDGEGFEKARAAAELRAAQFRAAFVEEARLSPEKQQALEALVTKMNGDLAKEAEAVVASLTNQTGQGQRIGPRNLVDAGVKLMSIYQRMDDELKAGLDDAGRAAMDRTRFDLITQVDIGALRKLGEVASQMNMPREPGR